MLKRLLILSTLLLPAWAGAAVISTVPIPDPAYCPGHTNGPSIATVLPHLSTEIDSTGVPFTSALIFKDWTKTVAATARLHICGFNPDGSFIGGSIVRYLTGSRIIATQTSGPPGATLAQMLQVSPSALNNRSFQIYLGVFDSFEYQVDFGYVGNWGQFLAFGRAPERQVNFYSPHGGSGGPFNTVYFVSNSATTGSPCVLTTRFYDDEGNLTAQRSTVVAPRARAAIDASLITNRFSAMNIETDYDCGYIYVMRAIVFPSSAVGGFGISVDTSR